MRRSEFIRAGRRSVGPQRVALLLLSSLLLPAQNSQLTVRPAGRTPGHSFSLEAVSDPQAGRIVFYDGVAPLGVASPDKQGSARATSWLSPGRHTIQAVEWGTGRSVGTPVTLDVATN